MTDMTETEIIIYFMAFIFGFIWGGLFFFQLGEQRANQKNIEFWNRYLGQQVKTTINNKQTEK